MFYGVNLPEVRTFWAFHIPELKFGSDCLLIFDVVTLITIAELVWKTTDMTLKYCPTISPVSYLQGPICYLIASADGLKFRRCNVVEFDGWFNDFKTRTSRN